MNLTDFLMESFFSKNDAYAADTCFDSKIPDGLFCGDCWKNKASRGVCFGLMAVVSLISITTVFLMTLYHYKRK